MKKAIFLCALLVSASATSQTDSLTGKLELLYSKSSFPGFAVAVVNKKGVIYQNGFGYGDLENKVPYTVNSVQNIGSVSKTFIGVALAKAIELGYFTLDTDINQILPFAVSNPNVAPTVITIRHLATHTSGILDDAEIYSHTFYPNEYSDASSPLYQTFIEHSTIPGRDDLALPAFLKNYLFAQGKWFRKTNFNAEKSGTEYNYSNIGAALAAYIIQLKSGIPFDEFCQKYIFDRLKMKDSRWKLTAAMAKKHVRLYNKQKQFYPLYSEITYPDGSLNTTCKDLSKYLSEMIKGYYVKSNVLSAKSFRLLFDKQFSDGDIPKNSNPSEPNGGIFWRIKKNGQIGHTGGDLGVTTFMFFDPATGTGKIFLANIEFDDPETGEINRELVASFLEIWKLLDSKS